VLRRRDKLLTVAYDRAPAWRYFPPTDPLPRPLRQVADAIVDLGDWFKDAFWPGAEPPGSMDTKLITKQLESYLPSDTAGVSVEPGLLRGWNVETRDPLARIPLLYGENGKSLYAVQPDAVFAGDDGYRALLEIEGGGALANYRLMKDVVETLLIPRAHHLALAVPHRIHGRSPYDFAVNLISALYAREVPQRHVRGILVVGY
jgi:hypothetical protein